MGGFLFSNTTAHSRSPARAQRRRGSASGPRDRVSQPQALFVDEDLEHALRQLVLYGRDGLPVLSHDRQLCGWITRNDVLRVLAERLSSSAREIEQGDLASRFADDSGETRQHRPSNPLEGYEILELAVGPRSPVLGHLLGEVPWPPGSHAVAVTEGREILAARSDMELHAGERIIILNPTDSLNVRKQAPAGLSDSPTE